MAAPKPDPRALQPDAYPFSVALPTRFGDVDVNWHLNNVAVTELLQEARIRFFDRIGAPADGEDGRWLVASFSVTFLAEGRYPDDVIGHVGVRRLGRTSVAFSQLLVQGATAIAYGEVALVLADRDGPTPIEGTLRASMADATLPLAGDGG